MREQRRRDHRVRRRGARRARRRRPARDGRLEPRAGGARQTFGVEGFHVLDTTHPEAIRALEAQLDLERTLFVVGVEVGLDARDALAHRLLLGEGPRRRAVRRDHRSRLRARAARARARLPRASSPASRRSAGATRRSRRSGWCPAALMGIDLDALARARERDGRGVPAGEGQPGPRARPRLGDGWQEGRDKVCIAERRRLRPLGGAADRRVDRQAGKGLVPAPGEPPDGADRQRARSSSPTRTSSARSSSAGSSRSPSPARPRDQPVRPAGRAGGEGQDERGARDGRRPELEPEGSLDELLAQARERRLRLHPGVRRADATSDAVAAARRPRARDRLRRHARLRAALPPLDGPAPQGRAEHGLFLQVVDDTGDELPIPGQPFGFGRLIRAQAAGDYAVAEGARPPGRARPAGGASDAARDDRPRPDGRQHDRAAARARSRREDVRPPGRVAHRRLARGAERPARRAARLLDDGPGRQDHRGRFQELLELADAGDTIVDGGNSNFRDSQRRYARRAGEGHPLRRRRRLGRHLGARGRLLPDGRRRRRAGAAARAGLHDARARGRLRARRRVAAPATSRRWSTTGSSTA